MDLVPGSTDHNLSHGRLRQVEKQDDPKLCPKSLLASGGSPRLVHPGPVRVRGPSVDELVAPLPSPEEGSVSAAPSSAGSCLHGRQPLRLGRSRGREDSVRCLDGIPEVTPYQCSGNVSGGEHLPTLPSTFERKACRVVHGQLDSDGLSEEPGRYQVASAHTGSDQSSLMARSSVHHLVRTPPSGQEERAGGCALEERQTDSDGVVPEPTPGSQSPRLVGGPPDRPLRNFQEQEGSVVRLTLPRSESLEGGRSLIRVDRDSGLRVPSVPANSHGPGEDLQSTSLSRGTDSSEMADTEVVSETVVVTNRRSQGSTNITLGSSAAGLPTSSETGVAPSSRLVSVRRSLAQRGFSRQVADFLHKSTRASSAKVYDAQWAGFSDWCLEREIDPLGPSVAQFADFLMYLFQVKKLSVSAIKGYRSAIAHTWRSCKVPDISLDEVISKMVSAFSIERPRLRVLVPPWNLSVVLRYLSGPPFEPMATAPWKEVVLKTVFLIAFATAARRSELHALSVGDGQIAFSDDGKRLTLRLDPQFLAKNQAPGEIREPFKIRALAHRVVDDEADASLCPVRALRIYLKVSRSFRGTRRKLFLSLQKNATKEISKDTIARWLVTVISQAHNRAVGDSALQKRANVTAHQVRAMATSWSAFAGADVDSIKKAAFWKGSTTFSSFYLRVLSSKVREVSAFCPLVAAQRVCQGDEFINTLEDAF